MATIKVFDCNGVKELTCFCTLDNVDYLPVEDPLSASQDEEAEE